MSSRMIELRPVDVVLGLLVAVALIMGALGLRSPAPASAATGSVITVSGEGVVEVAPDTATVSLGVQRQAATTAEAIKAHAAAMNAVIAALKQAGVKDEGIKTTSFSVEPLYDYSVNGKPPALVGYRVTNMVTCESQDLQRLGQLIDAAVAAGANQVNGITFTVKDVAALRATVIDKAVKDARAKADAAAKAAGVKIRRIRSISLESPFEPPVYRLDYHKNEAAGGAVTPIEPGTQSVRVVVSIIFEI